MRTRPMLREADNEAEAKTYEAEVTKIWPRGRIDLEDLTSMKAKSYNTSHGCYFTFEQMIFRNSAK